MCCWLSLRNVWVLDGEMWWTILSFPVPFLCSLKTCPGWYDDHRDKINFNTTKMELHQGFWIRSSWPIFTVSKKTVSFKPVLNCKTPGIPAVFCFSHSRYDNKSRLASVGKKFRAKITTQKVNEKPTDKHFVCSRCKNKNCFNYAGRFMFRINDFFLLSNTKTELFLWSLKKCPGWYDNPWDKINFNATKMELHQGFWKRSSWPILTVSKKKETQYALSHEYWFSIFLLFTGRYDNISRLASVGKKLRAKITTRKVNKKSTDKHFVCSQWKNKNCFY